MGGGSLTGGASRWSWTSRKAEPARSGAEPEALRPKKRFWLFFT
nr:hypothetical protein [Ectobacillus panaciterrae]